jgi:hypothetical protein
MLPLRQLSDGFGVKQIDGIIGTTLFYHFLTTMDYPHGELVLRRKDAKSLDEFKAQSSGKRVTVPIWMASDHFMVGWGRVETLRPRSSSLTQVWPARVLNLRSRLSRKRDQAGGKQSY